MSNQLSLRREPTLEEVERQAKAIAKYLSCICGCGLFIATIVCLCLYLVPQDTIKDVQGWQNSGVGLNMYIMNSCDETWSDTFDEYIDKWNSGTPDSLTLTSGKYDHDPECTAYTGVINVCNGDYGETGWTGIATTWSDILSGYTVSATARLNDYYLIGASSYERKYNMCHELGHTFSLPHTDEKHFNPDRHECMDYTVRYWNNLNPGQANFDRLNQLYGSVPNNSTAVSATSHHGRLGAPSLPNHRISESALKQYHAVLECLESPCSECIEQYNGTRRMLHKNKNGETCEFIFDDYKVISHNILARPN